MLRRTARALLELVVDALYAVADWLRALDAAWDRLLARLRRPDPVERVVEVPVAVMPSGVVVDTPLRVPVRNARRDQKRELQAVMSELTGRDLSPKAARKAARRYLAEHREEA